MQTKPPTDAVAMLELQSIHKSFHDGETELSVLRGVDLVLGPGSSVALMGASGSGKSTFLQIAAGLDAPDAGEVRLMGKSLTTLREPDLARLRRRYLGFVFQQFNLLPGLTVRDNVLFQRRLNGLGDKDTWVEHLVDDLELSALMDRSVERLSVGEQQRVAIGRALAHRPRLIFADEPTGNLNEALSEQIMRMFRDLVARASCGLVMVTHNRRMAAFTEKQWILEGGRLHAAASDAA